MADARTAVYLDLAETGLNPARAALVKNPAHYRWCSYGEAIGGGPRGNEKTAHTGLARAYFCNEPVQGELAVRKDVERQCRRLMGMTLGSERGKLVTMKTAQMLESGENETALQDLKLADLLQGRVRYFTDGAVSRSKSFVNEAFDHTRERFGPHRKSGARTMKRNAHSAKDLLWSMSMRDLRMGIS